MRSGFCKMSASFCVCYAVASLLMLIMNERAFCSNKNRFEGSRVKIPEGKFLPQFGVPKSQPSVKVATFWIDSHPVTEKSFLGFLENNAEWLQESKIESLVDAKYKTAWITSKTSKPLTKYYYPATNVSWFAAQAYCESNNGRLPTTFEWEFVANASESKLDAGKDPEFIQKILNWYGKTNSNSPFFSVYQGVSNAFGVYHMHGLIWEWTYDFNSTFMTGDSRQNGEKDNNFVCGVGSLSAEDRENYAAFMRYSLRSSLKANDSLLNMGFRCAYDSAS